ncbi:MAG: hypothetical protein A2015_09540 [Spirochaetes bacterium GWF1_31_7]|nr:MAG: hypothetical protein A2Y30_01230 [Spirochaetes bacterium GWE1_32_154]OHD45095.1 MAG: hypothetical protein A2Y29_15275 [Spirochaetes bacterium GWE2_31_10]OHD52662.1 MAG: hypothetical protein A2015_09540 [Spirochaetes bacterium GWF1_31_7]OHD75870.1 MAG: hypothetical protein A2355_04145 [Spirochaetes bacterium RIFOXYB1_FULL_32_8]HBD95230.1 NAD(P)-dependent alcohol dehydrogenase [Spirochaetia bacterium]
MKAVMFTEYGSPDVLKICEIAKPVPKDNEILIKVMATQINYGDLIARDFAHIKPAEFNMSSPLWLLSRFAFGFNKPAIKILGSEFSGIVEAVGKGVSRFKSGDEVYGYAGMNMGANAEYICLPETGTIGLKPVNLTFEEVATLPYGTVMATSLLEKAHIKKGDRILIIGASGGIGSIAVQLAKHYGAHVTGVCSTSRLGYVKSIGAEKVIDYTNEDYTKDGEMYDVIFDILGRGKFSKLKSCLKPDGIYLLASFKMKQVLQMVWSSISRSKQKVICSFASEKSEALARMKEIAESGEIKVVIDTIFPLSETATAHRYVESGNRTGNVVIKIG